MRTQKVFLASLVVVAAVVAGEPAWSQIWPQKPERIVVPFAPGGNTDGIARLIAQPLGETFGQLFVVENRPGAAGAIAAEAVARAPADGHTLLMGTPSQIAIIPAMTKTPYDPVAGHVPIYFATLSEAVSQARGGAIRLLAVSSENRVPQIADVPTFAESGFPGFKVLTWNGLMAPAAVPKETIDRIAKEVSRAVKDAKFAERLAAFGIDPLGNTPVEFAAMIAADIAMWSEAIKIAGVQEK